MMDKKKRTQIRNSCFDCMMVAHDLKETAVSKREVAICEAVYEAHWALYQLLIEREQKEFERMVQNERQQKHEGPTP